MESNEPRDDQLICPACGFTNAPDAVFCGNCGTSLRDGANPGIESPIDDALATSVYVPIREPAEREEPPLWSPEPPRDTMLDADPGQTSAIPVGQTLDYPDAPAANHEPDAVQERQESIRGFMLGTVSIILIAAVIALYVYSAWLSDSMRDTIDGWLPWAI